MALSPFDHPVLSGLLGDEEAATHLGWDAEIAAMIAFEVALAEAEAEAGLISADAGGTIASRLASFRPDMERLRTGNLRDGVMVPDFVAQLRHAVGEPHGKSVHFGATSQDVVDTALVLRLKPFLGLVEARLSALIEALDALNARDGGIETMGHTRMQAAIPVPASRKILSWRDPLKRSLARLANVREDVLVLHLAGAAGTLEKLGDKADTIGADVAKRLGLRHAARPLHSERDGVVAFADWLALVTGSLGKMGQDIALLAQSEVGEIKLAGGGGSSAMPHKVNPVGAETLVALARFNATQVGGINQSMVHEYERSGAAWTLEWMLLPQMCMATAASLRTAAALLDGLSFRKE